MKKNNYAFIDGSFNPKTNIYGGGGILIDSKGNRHFIFESGSNPRLSKMRNVAGEILGSKITLLKALELGIRMITIFYDYEGVANWATGKWKCRNEETKKYSKFIKSLEKKGMRIKWQHVKSHTGILENEEVDMLAKMVVGITK